MSRRPLQIQRGSRWSEFTYRRTGFDLLGVVRDGMQIGALARLPDGSYAQVNGDAVRLLNASRVERALVRAKLAQRRATLPDEAITMPTVMVKKRRLIRQPSGSSDA